MEKKILVIDDEKLIVKGLKFSLEQEGYIVECAYDGEEGLNMVCTGEFDMVLLDLMMPKIDGMEACRQIREFTDIPVIMLTAKGDDMDKILGFENGADDYITKPFNILEVKARIKAILRRNGAGGDIRVQTSDNFIEISDMRMDTEGRNAWVNGREISLTVKEFDLLELLINNRGKVFSRENILNLVWGYEYPGDVRTVDVHIRRLREKIEPNPSEPTYVQTKWGVGYYFHIE